MCSLNMLASYGYGTINMACFFLQALAQDQLRALLNMTTSFEVDLSLGVYDGDTSQEDRIWIRDNARLVYLEICTPIRSGFLLLEAS